MKQNRGRSPIPRSVLPRTAGGGNSTGHETKKELEKRRPSTSAPSKKQAKPSGPTTSVIITSAKSKTNGFYYGANQWSNPPPPVYYSSTWDSYVQPTPVLSLQSSVGNFPVSSHNFQEYHWRPGSEPYYSGSGMIDSARLGYTGSTTSTASSRSGSAGPPMDFHNFMLGEGPPMPRREWEHTGLGAVLRNKNNESSVVGTGVRFTLLTYNVLAPSLVAKHPELYTECDAACLDWNSRLVNLFNEMTTYAPDILCLQEVEAAQFKLTFKPRLEADGYRGVFKKKTGDKEDGCAIFYKASRFLLLDKLDVEFLQPHVPLLNRDNIGLLVKLETRNVVRRQKIVVGTTHLLFNPKRLDVRLAQAQLLLAELDRFAFCGFDRDGNNSYHPILLTGDFNCKPDSSVVRLFTERRLQCLDENGEHIRLLKRYGCSSLLPPQCGITDQCQHYKIALERFKRWKASGINQFELDLKTQNTLVNLFPFMESRLGGLHYNDSETCLLTPPGEDIVSLLSPVTEGVEPVPSVVETGDSKLLERAAQKIAMQVVKPENQQSESLSTMEIYMNHSRTGKDKVFPGEVDVQVVTEMKKCGMACDFGSGQLSHSLQMRDIHSARLDRTEPGAPVSTKQNGWVCVDYIFQSMVYSPQLNRPIEGRLKLIRRLGLLSRNQCKQLGDIPNSNHPSDHFPVVAEFLLR